MTCLNVSVLLFDAFSNMVLACLLDPLRVARDQNGVDIRWTILTHEDQPLQSSSGMAVSPDMPCKAAPRPDLTLIIGGDLFRGDIAMPSLRRNLGVMLNAPTVIAADTGAWLLARCGYLDDRKVTLHWQLLDEFAETFPQVHVSRDRYVKDGRFLTCGSAAAGFDLILTFIRDHFGPAAAFDVGAMFLHDNSNRHGASYPEKAMSLQVSEKVKAAFELMSESLEYPLSTPALARAVNMSERSFHRLFKRELSLTPGRYYQMLRLARARELARYSGLSLGEIALRCGFANATTLSRSFRKQFGVSLRPFCPPS